MNERKATYSEILRKKRKEPLVFIVRQGKHHYQNGYCVFCNIKEDDAYEKYCPLYYHPDMNQQG
jgi:hypothetical protein